MSKSAGALTLSDLAASTLVVGESSTWPPVAEALLQAVHPADRWTADPEKPLTMPAVRELHRFAQQTPAGQEKLVIIFQADLFKPEVANALLKLLEEPPAYLRLVLFSESVRLLPTLLSRLRVLYLEEGSGSESDFHLWKEVLESYNLADAGARQEAQELLYLSPLLHPGIQQAQVRAAYRPPK